MKIEELSSDVQGLKTTVDGLVVGMSELKTTVNGLVVGMGEIKTTVHDLASVMEKGFSAMISEITEIKSDISVLKEDVAGLKYDVRDIKVTLDNHDEKLDFLIERDLNTQNLFDDVFPRLVKLERRKSG